MPTPEEIKAEAEKLYPENPFYMRGENYAPTDLNENKRDAFIDGYTRALSSMDKEMEELMEWISVKFFLRGFQYYEMTDEGSKVITPPQLLTRFRERNNNTKPESK